MAYRADRFRGQLLTRVLGGLWGVVVFGVCAAVAAWPAVGLLVLAGVGLLACVVFFPRVTVGLTILVIVFIRTVAHLVPMPQLGYLHEVMVALCALVLPLRRLAQGQPLRGLPGQHWFVAFAAFGLLSGVVVGAAPTTVLLGWFVVCKGWIFGWAVAQLDWAERHIRVAARVGVGVVGVCLLGVVANLLAPGAWDTLLANKGAVDVRFGLPSLVGPFVHPLDLGAIMSAACIALLAWRGTVDRRPLTLLLAVATGAAAVLSFRRTAMTGLLAGAIWLKAKLRDFRLLLVLALMVPLAGVLLFAQLNSVISLTYNDYIVGGASSARTVLTRDSFDLALQRFPLGAGFGRFGSQVAAMTYSPEYIARGYPGIYGLGTTAKTGQFLTDTEWPALLGETGLVGAAAFLLGLAAVYRRAHRLWKSDAPPLLQWSGLVAIGWTVDYLVQSVANVMFTGPPAFGPFFALAGVLAAVTDHDTHPLRSSPQPADAGAARHDRAEFAWHR